MAAAKVIQPEMDSKLADLIEYAADVSRLPDVRRLGDLQVEMGDVPQFLDPLHERSLFELARRQIDVEPHAVPLRGIAVDALHHPGVEAKHFRPFFRAGGDRLTAANFSAPSTRPQ